jgi:hypothetical protein
LCTLFLLGLGLRCLLLCSLRPLPTPFAAATAFTATTPSFAPAVFAALEGRIICATD